MNYFRNNAREFGKKVQNHRDDNTVCAAVSFLLPHPVVRLLFNSDLISNLCCKQSTQLHNGKKQKHDKPNIISIKTKHACKSYWMTIAFHCHLSPASLTAPMECLHGLLTPVRQ